MSEPADFHPCVGICMTDADAAYCLGCGRPWGEPRAAQLPAPTPAAPEAAGSVPEVPTPSTDEG